MTESEERLQAALVKTGWKILRNGWPDFLCVGNAANGRQAIAAVELKTRHDHTRPSQLAVHDVLRKAGIPVHVVIETSPGVFDTIPHPEGGQTLRRPSRAPMRGVFEHPKGSGIWWISWYVGGKRHRQKIGSLKNAVSAYYSRKTEALKERQFGYRFRLRQTTPKL